MNAPFILYITVRMSICRSCHKASHRSGIHTHILNRAHAWARYLLFCQQTFSSLFIIENMNNADGHANRIQMMLQYSF